MILFYGWWQFATCLFAFFALMAIWWHIGRKQKDLGQVWLAFSILSWSVSGAFEIYFNETVVPSKVQFEGWRSIFSLLNSLFILMALPWFRFLPKPLVAIITSKYWIYIIGLPFIFSILPTISRMISGKTILIISELDVYYSFLTLIFLGAVLWESFAKRRLKALAWLSLGCVFLTLVAQYYKLSGSLINVTILSAIFKTCLIMIFFALALSWVKELSENIIPEAKNLHLVFLKIKRDNNRLERIVIFKGFPGTNERKVVLTPALYNLFLDFAKRKKHTDNPWLEIRPKNYNLSNKEFDINDYNQIKRLLIAVLDSLFGKGNWSQDHHLKPLKSTIFKMSESRSRKICLSIPSQNIALE